MITQTKEFKVFHVGEKKEHPELGQVNDVVLVAKDGMAVKVFTTVVPKVGISVDGKYQLQPNLKKVKSGTFHFEHKGHLPYRFDTFLENAPQDVVDYLFGVSDYTIYACEEGKNHYKFRLVEMKFNQEVEIHVEKRLAIIRNWKVGDTFAGGFGLRNIHIQNIVYFNSNRL